MGTPGSPLNRENWGNGQNNSLSGKTRGIWKCYQNTGNTTCSSCKLLDSKGKEYCNIYFAANIFFRSWICLPSPFCVYTSNSHKSHTLAQGVVGHGKHRKFEKCNLSGDTGTYRKKRIASGPSSHVPPPD